jgi:hypothetical protein
MQCQPRRVAWQVLEHARSSGYCCQISRETEKNRRLLSHAIRSDHGVPEKCKLRVVMQGLARQRVVVFFDIPGRYHPNATLRM